MELYSLQLAIPSSSPLAGTVRFFLSTQLNISTNLWVASHGEFIFDFAHGGIGSHVLPRPNKLKVNDVGDYYQNYVSANTLAEIKGTMRFVIPGTVQSNNDVRFLGATVNASMDPLINVQDPNEEHGYIKSLNGIVNFNNSQLIINVYHMTTSSMIHTLTTSNVDTGFLIVNGSVDLNLSSFNVVNNATFGMSGVMSMQSSKCNFSTVNITSGSFNINNNSNMTLFNSTSYMKDLTLGAGSTFLKMDKSKVSLSGTLSVASNKTTTSSSVSTGSFMTSALSDFKSSTLSVGGTTTVNGALNADKSSVSFGGQFEIGGSGSVMMTNTQMSFTSGAKCETTQSSGSIALMNTTFNNQGTFNHGGSLLVDPTSSITNEGKFFFTKSVTRGVTTAPKGLLGRSIQDTLFPSFLNKEEAFIPGIGVTINIEMNIANHQTMNVAANAQVQSFIQSSGLTLLQSGGSLQSKNDIIINGGALLGQGSLSTTTVTSAAIGSSSTLNNVKFNGDLNIQDSLSNVTLLVNNATSYSTLDINGTASLNGIFTVMVTTEMLKSPNDANSTITLHVITFPENRTKGEFNGLAIKHYLLSQTHKTAGHQEKVVVAVPHKYPRRLL
ncbi:hypothetical protein SAMD00019534_059330 [Acytostelium subglobosum LB1]|uniref:hypothetical protein n=1 Tax=Acytostelium subglobosum LB1 TaxID=1410327 RepID=UPI0006449D43|nr:hypothetical protein SAMD00019534_059330 [Acytostelium subglobosum LB1]GAM22758.1 hypothetical protein SAMD00019534_059330 [Acytostelium subglobosum LB1]|eukprot:XP_012753985.1 hypothetical protein SAMD00019534_059330 [Acytostelium subglobosum LB1]